MRRDQIALQMYTVREDAGQDFVGTLKKVAEMGYPAVEFAGFGGMTAADLRAKLDEFELKAPSAHVAYVSLLEDAAAACADLHTLGTEYAVVPFIGNEHRTSVDAARRFAASLNTIAKTVTGEGLRFAYHNHDFEFRPLPDGGGKTMWDILQEETDPATVALELDIYWVTYGGGDALATLKANPVRYPLLHFKDMQGAGQDLRDAPVGEGTVDWGPYLAASEGTSHWFIVEQDTPDDPFADIERSLREMEKLAG